MTPLVTCVTPTYNRRGFWPRCVRCFQWQDWPNLEWVIADNGTDPIADLLPSDPRIRYYPFGGKKLTHGTLMNECFRRASGEICIVVDDDDWYAPNRVSKQVQPMIDNPSILTTGTGQLYYYMHGTKRAFRYRNLTNNRWIGAFAMRKSVWEARPFNDKPHGADFDLLGTIPREQWMDLKDLTLMVSAIHPGNAAPKIVPSPSFLDEPWEIIETLTRGTI